MTGQFIGLLPPIKSLPARPPVFALLERALVMYRCFHPAGQRLGRAPSWVEVMRFEEAAKRMLTLTGGAR